MSNNTNQAPGPDMPVQDPLQPVKEEKGFEIPISFIRWALYSQFFAILLLKFILFDPWLGIGTCLVLGHFSGQLNKLIDKIDKL